jgi:hypothetical protein
MLSAIHTEECNECHISERELSGVPNEDEWTVKYLVLFLVLANPFRPHQHFSLQEAIVFVAVSSGTQAFCDTT